MGKGTIKTKAMTMAVAMSMVAGLCPSTVFAANSEDVAKVQDGTYTGPLAGVPIAVKDNICIKGTAGAPAYYENQAA